MSSSPEPVTTAYVNVKDYLAESLLLTKAATKQRRYRRHKQESKAFTCCQQCGSTLVSKWKTLRGTDVIAKAICRECKEAITNKKAAVRAAEVIATHGACDHLHLRLFTFTNGRTIEMCPDCTTFDAKRHRALCKGEALKDCCTTTKKATKTLRRKKWDRQVFDLTKMRRWKFSGMSHFTGRSHEDLRFEGVDVTTPWTPKVPKWAEKEPTYCNMRRFLVAPSVALQPIKPSVVYEYTLVPLNRAVKSIDDCIQVYEFVRRKSLYLLVDRHTPQRSTGSDLTSNPSGPACMWLWPGFRDRTMGKTIGKLHNIDGRWCQCAECLATRKNR